MVEFHRPTSAWGFTLQAAYDSRRGTFKQQFSPCNCPRDLATKVNYLTFEPSLRWAPFKSDLYLFAGPRFAYNTTHSFIYKQGNNPEFPEPEAVEDIEGDLSDMQPLLVSAQIGAGYDIHLSKKGKKTQLVLSPFASFHPYFGQSPRSIETWNVTTLRIGAALKIGAGKLIPEPLVMVPFEFESVAIPEPNVVFSIYSPENIPAQRTVREVFPLRNQVYFDLGSNKIPDRYILLQKDQVQKFHEDQVDLSTPANLSGRSERQMVVYYNIMNILGDRMVKNPDSKVMLLGSSGDAANDGLVIAQSVKTYLVSVFGIDPVRIATKAQTTRNIPADGQGAPNDLRLIREGNRKVTIESDSPELLMEFRSGPAIPLPPLATLAAAEAPLESYISLKVEGADEAFVSWDAEITDEKGAAQRFGPYTEELVLIPGEAILGERTEGTYTIVMKGKTDSGEIIKKYGSAHMVRWSPPIEQVATRFSVLYEFDESKVGQTYIKHLQEVVVPSVPQGATVILHGYTDIIGESKYNTALSRDRADDVHSIMDSALTKAGTKAVKFEIYGSGEDPRSSPFPNKFPEDRTYNRTVVIDIVPAK